jgi:hypothetical protein
MSLLLTNSLTEAIALARGESPSPDRRDRFPLTRMSMWRLSGINPAIGHAPIDSDSAWESTVRALWSTGTTWALCVTGESAELAWDLAFPVAAVSTANAVSAHLPGAQLNKRGDFSAFAARFQKLPFVAAMAGHTGTADFARLETAIRAIIQSNFLLLVLAKAVSRPEIENELRRLATEEQFVRDEYLSRASLEHDSHARADHYLSLVQAANERAVAALQEGGWQARVLLGAGSEDDFQRAQSLIHSAFAGDGGKPEPLRWQDVNDPRALTFLRTGEVAALTRPPKHELPGFSIEVAAESSGRNGEMSAPSIFATTAARSEQARSIAVGLIIDDANQTSSWLEITTDELDRHVLVAGMTGSGKSTTCEHLLLELWREHQIPWLVIEPGMKTAYRRLLNSEIALDLQVRAIGVANTQRISLNPMAAPSGIGLAEHTAGLFAVISAAFELVPPMPEVLATAIEQTYRNHGWNLAGAIPKGDPPRLRDLIEEIDRSTSRLGYSAEISDNIRAGLLLRLQRLLNGPLAPELGVSNGLDVEPLVARPTIIELSALPDADSQALVMGFLALQLRHYWRLAGQSDSLRHVTLIEEAHRLLRAVPETTTNASRSRAAQDLANMLAELRAFGAGLVIVDQTPSALVPSVIANTSTKILHRLDHPADRELAGRAAGMPADHVDLLGKLPVGDAVVRCNQRSRPFRLRMPNPAVTYQNLPLPELERSTAVDKSDSAKRSTESCLVCGFVGCVGQATGAANASVTQKLERLKDVSQQSEDAVWNWALDEVRTAGVADGSPNTPLCFLIALCRAAKLPDSTLNRLRAAFESRTKTN